MRASQGGHDVPAEKILSRYPRTLSNLRAGRGAASIRFADGEATVLSNTTGFEIVHGPAPRPKPPDYVTTPGSPVA
jgi:predicted ABC-type ATPase